MTSIPGEFPLPKEAFERQRSLLRAQAKSPQHRRRALAIAVAAAASLAALLVAPAFGIADDLIELLQRQPAPPEVQTYFASSNATREELLADAEAAGLKLHDRFSRVVADESRGVAAIESADGPIFLWAAPTEDGRQCWLIQAGADGATGRPYGYGSCDDREATNGIRPGTFWTAERPSVKVVHARIYDEAIEHVETVVDDGTGVSLRVVAGHALGTIPKEARVRAFVGRDKEGEEVFRTTLP